jgi:hypothetical protein
MPGVIWIRSYISDAEGKIYCEYDAPDQESVREHARQTGLPVGRISEVSLEISPAMFRQGDASGAPVVARTPSTPA